MLSKKDIKTIQEMIETTFDRKFDEKFDQKFKEKFEQLREYFSNLILQFKDDILTEVQDNRIDLEVLRGKTYDHEDRITQIERHLPNIKPSV